MAGKKRSTQRSNKVLVPRGSQHKRSSRDGAVLLDPKQWSLAAIAYDRNGDLVVLDPRLARFLANKAREDGEIRILRSSSPLKMGGRRSLAGYDPFPEGTTTPVRIPRPLALCVCGGQIFRLSGTLRPAAAPTRAGV